MKHLSKFNEHIYNKAVNIESKNWMDNFNSLVKYLKNQIENRQVKNFKKDGDRLSFLVMGRKYVLDTTSNSITLFSKKKNDGGSYEDPVTLNLKSDQCDELINLLKKPLKSPKAEEQGRRPYLKD